MSSFVILLQPWTRFNINWRMRRETNPPLYTVFDAPYLTSALVKRLRKVKVLSSLRMGHYWNWNWLKSLNWVHAIYETLCWFQWKVSFAFEAVAELWHTLWIINSFEILHLPHSKYLIERTNLVFPVSLLTLVHYVLVVNAIILR